MKKITKEDKRYIEAMRLWAANLKDRIKMLDDESNGMIRQTHRNEAMVELEQEALSEELKEQNEWRLAEGYPTVKSL